MTTDVSAILHASAARTATGVGSEIAVRTRDKVDFILDVTAHAGTTPTLDVVIQGRDPASQKWIQLLDDAGSALAFAQVTTTDGSERITLPAGLADTNIRIAYTISGSAGQSYTFTVSMVARDN